MRKLVVLFAMGVVAVAVGGAVPSTSEAQGKPPNRVIELRPTGLGDLAVTQGHRVGGHVFISQPNAPVQNQPEGVHQAVFQIKDLERQEGTSAFAVYATHTVVPEPNPTRRCRIVTFNTTESWTYNGFNFMTDSRNPAFCDPLDPAWLTELVTIEVFLEEDDGEDAPDVGAVLLLRGDTFGFDHP